MTRQIAEGCIHYEVHLPGPAADAQELLARLTEVADLAESLLQDLCADYTWHSEAPSLAVNYEPSPHLSGTTSFEDSIEDEWLILYILRCLSHLAHDVWIKIEDSDGHFLLIEAADVLPNWMTPDTTENRIWINAGRLVFIEKEFNSLERKSLGIGDALSQLCSESPDVVYNKDFEAAAFYRLRRYPEQIEQNQHHTVVTVPRKLSLILNAKPKFVSAAIAAFDARDPSSLRRLQRKYRSPSSNTSPNSDDAEGYRLIFPPHDMVNMTVKFNRLGFAQLKNQQFETPASWQGKLPLRSAPNYHRAELGMRVTAGFEMLMADRLMRDHGAVKEIMTLLDAVKKGALNLPSRDQLGRWPKRDDPENWMYVDLADIEREREQRQSLYKSRQVKPTMEESDPIAERSESRETQQLLGRVSALMAKESGVGGIVDDSDEEGSASSDEEETILDADAWKALDEETDEVAFGRTMKEMMDLSPEDILKRNRTLGLEDVQAGDVRSLLHITRRNRADASKEPQTKITSTAKNLPVFGPPRPPSMLPFPVNPIRPKSPSTNTDTITNELIKVPPKVSDRQPSTSSIEDEDAEDDPDLSENEVLTELVDRFGDELKKMGAMGLDDPDMKAALQKANRVEQFKDKPQNKQMEVASSGSEDESEDEGQNRHPGARTDAHETSDLSKTPNSAALNQRFYLASQGMKQRLVDNESAARTPGAGRGEQPAPSRMTKVASSDEEDEKDMYEDLDDDDEDIDVELVKNMLASFKAQGGTSGPAGNMLGMLGLQLPRDEDSD